MPSVLSSPEYLLFLALVGGGGAFLAFRLRRLDEAPHLQRANLLLALFLAVLGGVRMERAQRKELGRLQSMLEGLAPTYAREMESLGHARLATDASPDDALYLRLIEAQKRWLAANPTVADIYTFRRLRDGTVVLAVDSETDYDRDGAIQGEREQRTPIGEVYAEGGEALEQAFTGQPTFNPEVTVDRWGAWVSAHEPLRGPDGSVEGVLGVDYPADSWLVAARGERLDQLGWLGALTLALQAALFVVAILLPHLRERRRIEGELVRALRTAEQSSQAKSRFLATVSHELRTPLNGVLGMSELLRDTRLDDEQLEMLGAVEASARGLKDLIDELLTISGAEQGGVRLVPREFDPAALVREVCSAHAQAAREKGVAWSLEVAPDVPASVFGDGQRLAQLLAHLLSNAVKFTERGEIRVSLTTEAQRAPGELPVSLCVRDTGLGFEPGTVDEIFRPFVQLDSSLSRRHGGAGLGLALVKEIARAMRGEITCESRPGQGSSFTFRVSFLQPPSRAASAAVASPDDGGTGQLPAPLPAAHQRPDRPTALVVDDQAPNRRLLECLLAARGWSSVCVSDGPSALEAFRARRFELVLLDLAMPGMDGVEALTHMRVHERSSGRRTRIMAVTALENGKVRSAHKALGFDGWIEKPVDSALLVVLLDEVAASAKHAVVP